MLMLFAVPLCSQFSQLMRPPFLLSSLPQVILLTCQVSLLPDIKNVQLLWNTDSILESKLCRCSIGLNALHCFVTQIADLRLRHIAAAPCQLTSSQPETRLHSIYHNLFHASNTYICFEFCVFLFLIQLCVLLTSASVILELRSACYGHVQMKGAMQMTWWTFLSWCLRPSELPSTPTLTA